MHINPIDIYRCTCSKKTAHSVGLASSNSGPPFQTFMSNQIEQFLLRLNWCSKSGDIYFLRIFTPGLVKILRSD